MKIALACCPSWSMSFPPYNISLLKAILKQNGHEVKIFEFNMQAYYFLKNDPINYWEGQNYFYWEGKVFDEDLLSKMTDLIDEWVEDLLEYNPEFIGFTVYHTSIRCTTHVIERIKEKNNSVKIIMGGPQCFAAGRDPLYIGLANYIATGEGESAILEALKCPDSPAIPSPHLTKINELPIPDYEDYDLMKYTRKMGISLEASRGCVAKCAFCMETHYWAFRSKKAENIVNEIKEYIEKYGANNFRFNDSLVNGNIKEFYKFVSILSKEKLGIKWDGYARINGEMDLDFMQKIKDSGNILLSYGVESGSQKVLNDMNKGITVAEIEQNLSDGNKVGLTNHVNWMVGFPTENPIDALYSLAFLFNNRKYIHNIAPGMTCGIGDKAALQTHKEKYGILEQYYWGNYVTKEFKNTAIHRFIRLKLTHIWLKILNIDNGQYHKNLDKHYMLNFFDADGLIDGPIDYRDCIDFSYLDKGTFESSLHAEYMLFFWVIYKVFGPFQMSITFDKKRDVKEFGEAIAKGYDALGVVNVNVTGRCVFRLEHSIEDVKPFDESILLRGNFDI